MNIGTEGSAPKADPQSAAAYPTKSLLCVENLTVSYNPNSPPVVDDVSFEINGGEILGLVGESGAGKSTVGRALIGLIEGQGQVSGQGRLEDAPLFTEDEALSRSLRGKRIGLIFQEPLSALNPVMRVGDQITEALRFTIGMTGRAARARAIDLMDQVGIPNPQERFKSYPHQFSGGMRQRVIIAIALAGEPDVLIADEPTTALDVSVQAGVLELLRSICKTRNLAVLLVTHDMAVVSQVTDRILVMRHGRVVEQGRTSDVLAHPTQKYTQALLAAVPPADRTIDRFPEQGPDGVLKVAPAPVHQAKTLHSEIEISVKDMRVEFAGKWHILPSRRTTFCAVNDVSLEVARGEAFGIVGESGSGKSTLALAMMGLVSRQAGDVRLGKSDVPATPNQSERRELARRVQMVFQDPFSSLQPRMTIGDIVAEPLIAHGLASASDAQDAAKDMLVRVGLDPAVAPKLPHQFSGGQRQRIAIARALMLEPEILICDEPTSALDVSIQAQVLNLLKDLQDSMGLTLLFVSHDLPVVRQMCKRIGVMHQGRLVEVGDTADIFDNPSHAYTQNLLHLMPRFEPPAESAMRLA